MIFAVEEPALRHQSFRQFSQTAPRPFIRAQRVPPIAQNGPAMLIPCLQTFVGHEASHQASVAADRRLGFHPAGNYRTGSAIPAGRTVHSSRNDYSLFAVRLGQISVIETAEAFSENSRCGRPVCCEGFHRVETIFSPSRNCPLKLASKRIEAASHFSQIFRTVVVEMKTFESFYLPNFHM